MISNECNTRCFFLCSKCCNNSFSRYHASLADSYTDGEKKERSQKIGNLPILVTHWPDTSAMLSSKVNGSIAHGSTR